MDQPLLSQHLQVLKHAGVVWSRRDGNRQVYGLRHRDYARLVAALDHLPVPIFGT